ncbi:MAG: MTH1187 family thiamine-binding protein [Gammaproteobacteria bacterium]|nr:MTH1187 family thiamine-binding protein [Gammaproteobacteria bacterium]
MKVHADICVIPMGVGVSVSEYVVACQEILNQAGLETRLHAYGTNVEGEWEDVMDALKQCHERVHELGAPRISTTLRLGTRTDREQSLQDKVDSVTSKMQTGTG